MENFNKLGLSMDLVNQIKGLGITKPTKIQSLSIPLIMKGKDVIGESATGSGKTIAFGSGVIEQTFPNGGIQALVLTPTRELAQQVKDSIKTISYKKRIKITTVFGGVSYGPQIKELSKADIVVATPGRLLDHIQRNTIDLSGVNVLVLDEADRMFDMGFFDDVEKIIQRCKSRKQTLFFSATISPRIKTLAKKYMNTPEIVQAIKHVDPTKLEQVYYEVSGNMKMSLLLNLLQHEKSGLVMVFSNTRKNTDFVAQNLKMNRIKAIPIHGGLSQNKRTKTIKSFNQGEVGVLVCTDVAARGLHIDNVSHVYNYDIPRDPTDYVHRIGRTARAGEEGKVINLLSKQDHENFARILYENRTFSVKKLNRPYLEKIQMVKPTNFSRGPRQGKRSFGRRNFGKKRFAR